MQGFRYNALSFLVLLSLVAFALVAEGKDRALFDLWVHPRGETYDPEVHYQDDVGEIYYKAENDIAQGLGDLVVESGPLTTVETSLGRDLWQFVEKNSGFLRPVIHWDTDGDRRIDRTLRGRIVDGRAVFDGPEVSDVDLKRHYWQLGVVYKKGTGGAPEFDGRYLASVDSDSAKVVYRRIEDLEQVAAGPGDGPGLVIFKHREGVPLDFADFSLAPLSYMGDFDALTRGKDIDDWTVEKDKGKLRTHFSRDDLFLVKTEGDYDLAVKWGDMPLEEYFEKRLAVERDVDGCYNGLNSRLVGDDDESAPLPNRLLYCPEESLAVFDVPDGYQVYLYAMRGGEVAERTEASNGIIDNIRLYAHEVYRRSPHKRATGTIWGNVRGGVVDAGQDMVDAGRHLVTGEYRTNIHTGQKEYRPSPITMLPVAAMALMDGKPGKAVMNVLGGVQSAVQIPADAASAATNTLVNPVLQVSVGLVSPEAADTAGHWVGALGQAWTKNFPAAERSVQSLNPLSLYYHNRAFWPTDYTRTDTQLNIDRIISLANIFALQSIIASATSDGGGGGAGGGARSGGGGGGGGGGTPAPMPAADPPPMMMMCPGGID